LHPYAAAIRSQQIVGGVDRGLEFALNYANERVQSGRPIAKF
jgi:alkylation response protein AidB-like acyl-CoA dehydrogenase